MNCPVQKSENAELVLDYFARRLSPETLTELDRHIELCPACQKTFGEQRQVWEALDLFEEENAAHAAVSQEFDWNLRQRIEAEKEAGWLTQVWNRWFASEPLEWKPVHSFAAVAAALVLGISLYGPWTGTETAAVAVPGAGEAQVVTAEVERVETALEDLEMLSVLHAVKPESADQKKM